MSERPSLFLTRRLPPEAMHYLHDHFQVRVNDRDEALSKQEIIDQAQRCSVLLCLLTDRIDAQVLSALPELQVISNYAVGFDNIDLQAATFRGIPVCNTPGVLTEATADLTWALLLAVSRRMVEADHFVRSGCFHGWDPVLMLGEQVSGRTLGIVGMGRIGQAVARRAQGFDMPVLYTKRFPLPAEQAPLRSKHVALEQLLKEADIVSLHLPYSQQVHHVIDEAALSRMQSSAMLINTARGALVDEQALVQALKRGDIAGAGLDVFEHEPAVHPGLLSGCPVVLAPHIGSATHRARVQMGCMAADNALAVLQGRSPHSVANPEVLKQG